MWVVTLCSLREGRQVSGGHGALPNSVKSPEWSLHGDRRWGGCPAEPCCRMPGPHTLIPGTACSGHSAPVCIPKALIFCSRGFGAFVARGSVVAGWDGE